MDISERAEMVERIPADGEKTGTTWTLRHVSAVGRVEIFRIDHESLLITGGQNVRMRGSIGNDDVSAMNNQGVVKVCDPRATIDDLYQAELFALVISCSDWPNFDLRYRLISACFETLPGHINQGHRRGSSCDPSRQVRSIHNLPPLADGSCRGTRILSAEGLSPVLRANKKHPAAATAGCDETKNQR